ncbi:wall-associated receptor kinase 5-like protein [Corchorus olitorius]|uniref:Wall-associated receptor kinase 5-like protein n=1 Tax=Corchorus olitorius TaxID=93759 RepID=A0A1R3J694_9ROSI|nr:wall-associated receptor kinase 5-like protein [Corchorus olitorius]
MGAIVILTITMGSIHGMIQFSERAKEVIMELKMRERFLHDNVKQLKKEVASLKNNVVEILEADIIEENITLKHGVRLLRVQLNEASGVSASQEGKSKVCMPYLSLYS